MTRGAPRPLVVLQEPADDAANWVAAGLRDRGMGVRQLTSFDICTHARFDLSIGRAGPELASATITLRGEAPLEAETIAGVLNRLSGISRRFLDGVAEEDRAYVEGEWVAGLAGAIEAWVERGVRVLDPPYPYALAGRWRSGAEWATLASRAGFRVAPWSWPAARVAAGGAGSGDRADIDDRADSDDRAGETVLVIGDRALGAAAAIDAAATPCLALARLAGVSILAIRVHSTAEGVSFLGATNRPDLRAGGPEAIDALIEAFA